MYYFNIFVKLIPFIFQAIVAAQAAFGKGEGPAKKAAVKGGITAMFEGAKEVSTGGQRETLEKVTPLFEAVIDKGIDLGATLVKGK